MDQHVLNLLVPYLLRPYRWSKMMAKVSQRQATQQSIRTLHVTLWWPDIDPADNLAQRIENDLRELVLMISTLEKVHIEISQRPGARIRTQAAEIVATILQIFPGKVVGLHLEDALLSGDLEGLMDALRDQGSLSTLHLERISPLPEHAGQQLPALFRTVSSLPSLKNFYFKSAMPVSAPHAPMVSSLVSLVTQPSLEVLDLRSVGIPQDSSQLITPVLQAIHLESSLQQLILGNSPGSTHSHDCELFSAVGNMLSSNRQLKSLTLYTANNTNLLKALPPVLSSFRTNRTLNSLSFVRPNANFGRTPLCIPDRFLQFLEKDNLTLESLDIYDMKGAFRPKVRVEDLLPATAEFYLKLNRGGRRLLLENDIQNEQSWMNMLWRHRGDVGVLYYYLKRNPDLVTSMRTAMPAQDQSDPKRCVPVRVGRRSSKRRKISLK